MYIWNFYFSFSSAILIVYCHQQVCADEHVNLFISVVLQSYGLSWNNNFDGSVVQNSLTDVK